VLPGQPALLVVLLNTFRYSRYLLVLERNAIHMVLHAEAQPRDMVQAYLQVGGGHMQQQLPGRFRALIACSPRFEPLHDWDTPCLPWALLTRFVGILCFLSWLSRFLTTS
jgi:hypothetical protein